MLQGFILNNGTPSTGAQLALVQNATLQGPTVNDSTPGTGTENNGTPSTSTENDARLSKALLRCYLQ